VTPLETIAPAVTCSVQVELQYLTELDIDFDVTVTGFELPEIDLLIGELLNADENVRQTPLLRFNLARQLPPGRHLANQQPSSDLRRFDNGRNTLACYQSALFHENVVWLENAESERYA